MNRLLPLKVEIVAFLSLIFASFVVVAGIEDLAVLAVELESVDESERTAAVVRIGELGSAGASAVPAILCMLYTDVDGYGWFTRNKWRRMEDEPGIRALAKVGVTAVPALVRVLETGPFGYMGRRWGGAPCPSKKRNPDWDGDLECG